MIKFPHPRIMIWYEKYTGEKIVKTFYPPYQAETFMGYVNGLIYNIVGDAPKDVKEVLSQYD